MVDLVHEFIAHAASAAPAGPALTYLGRTLTYEELAAQVQRAAWALLEAGVRRDERVAVYLEKRTENVLALFGAAAAGAVFVPVNPLLKGEQVAHILADCNVGILLTSPERLASLGEALDECPDLHTIFLTDGALPPQDRVRQPALLGWSAALAAASPRAGARRIDSDMAAILYTSGSTGRPKGVVLTHRNLVAGAASVASYLGNGAHDRILSVLPLSFDYGLSQLTTAFHSGASVVLMNYLMPRDIVRMVASERITGLAAVPPLWMQLAQLDWAGAASLRYLTNSGGAMQPSTLAALRARLPAAEVFLMYGLTEAFRSTYLPPAELERRPDSIGRAIPNAEVMVVRPDGTPCLPNEPGELVHRGALVARGYWNDAARTAERFRPAPGAAAGLPLPEIAVWSGDKVRCDEEGFLYFVGRDDDMIKVSGYRVSPHEVEEVVYATGLVVEAVALGVPHPQLGQAIVVVVACVGDAFSSELLLRQCQQRLPAYMVPRHVDTAQDGLPRTPNGKIDRKLLQQRYAAFFDERT